MKKCKTCEGTGQVWSRVHFWSKGVVRVTCGKCKGKGEK